MEFMEKVTKISKIVGKTARDTYNTVADKSGKVFEDAKLKLAIADKEADIEKIYEEIGKTVYDSYLAGEDVGKVFTKEAKKIDKISNEIALLISKIILILLSLIYCFAIFYLKNVWIFCIIIYLWILYFKEEKKFELYLKILNKVKDLKV